jgi:DNA helicase-2/ATP-dependent DNA helicase PcrA
MQAEILKYRSGRMGVAAVPGSGKTATLSALAAQLISEGCIQDDQEILIVTLVNSAVDNFSTRIATFMREAGLLENMGYRVRTLHGLAHDIVRERPDLVNLSERFTILDETESSRMIEAATAVYLREHPELAKGLVDPAIDLHEEPRTQKSWNEMITTLNINFISQAKDLQIEAVDVRKGIEKYHLDDALIEMAAQIYADYQRGLKSRGAVDFSDLIRLAYLALLADQEFLERLRYRWPYILEDEAQDSSQVQEKILRLLTGSEGNWVRVGDTNQAIYETFTTASPMFLRNFLREKNVASKDLANSGRSNKSIIKLANALNQWTQKSHPVAELRNSLTLPLIVAAPIGDPQPNPPDHAQSIYILNSAVNSEREVRMVADSIKTWLPEHQDKTVAVLCPIAFHAEKVVEALEARNIEVVEMLKSTQSTRRVTRLLEKVLLSLSDPSAVNKISAVFQLLLQEDPEFEGHKQDATILLTQLKKIRQLEDLLYPVDLMEWSEILQTGEIHAFVATRFSKFLSDMVRWQNATPLPIDQLILTIGRDLFTAPHDLALTHKLALSLEISACNHPEYQLPQFALELQKLPPMSASFLLQ